MHRFISRKCILRGIPVTGTVSDWQSALKSAMVMEKLIELLDTVKQWYDSGWTEVPLVEVIELIIPCILHLENRVNEKIVTTIL
jgi:hypothetical protein